MRNDRSEHALACVGAVIGAGFASGREIITFFSRYGGWSWLLAVMTAATMTALGTLIIRQARSCGCSEWMAVFRQSGKRYARFADACLLLLFGVTGGAMLSGGGELVALVLPWRYAYGIGLALTLLLAWLVAGSSIRSLAGFSAALLCLLLVSYLLLLVKQPAGRDALATQTRVTAPTLVRAIVFAIAYAGMNITVGLGVICECACKTDRGVCRSMAAFGIMMMLLMFLGNALFLRQDELPSSAIPIAALLSKLGRAGYLIGVSTLYLAVFTTLASILRALKTASQGVRKPFGRLYVLLPPVFSTLGFANLIERCYAIVGLICVALLLIPIVKAKCTNKSGEICREPTKTP